MVFCKLALKVDFEVCRSCSGDPQWQHHVLPLLVSRQHELEDLGGKLRRCARCCSFHALTSLYSYDILRLGFGAMMPLTCVVYCASTGPKRVSRFPGLVLKFHAETAGCLGLQNFALRVHLGFALC